MDEINYSHTNYHQVRARLGKVKSSTSDATTLFIGTTPSDQQYCISKINKQEFATYLLLIVGGALFIIEQGDISMTAG